MNNIVIIDCDAVCWAVFHALPPMSYKEEGTAVIYGFINHIFDMSEYHDIDHWVFAWDSRSSKRAGIFPDYKLKRKNKKLEYTEEEIAMHSDRARQFRELKKVVLPDLGFTNVLYEEGFEGDDIIGSVVRDYEKTHMITIVGRDNDLYQLISPTCRVYDHVERRLVDEEYFFEKKGILPDMWADVKAIAGCTTDEVPGVHGIGNDRAIKYLLGNMKATSVLYQRIESSPALIELTRRLTTLPFEGTPHYEVKEDECAVKKFKAVARKYGLESYLVRDRLRQFRRAFCGKEKTTQQDTSGVGKPRKNVFERKSTKLKLGVSKFKR